MKRPTEFTIVGAKTSGWLVYVDSTEGRPDFAGTISECADFIRQRAEPVDVMAILQSLDMTKGPNDV